MSGGVDSAVTAYLLKKEGYDVCGVTLRTWAPDDGSEGRCCEIDDARRVSNALGIRFYPLNCISDFSEKVVDLYRVIWAERLRIPVSNATAISSGTRCSMPQRSWRRTI